jgi:hypothetical protein
VGVAAGTAVAAHAAAAAVVVVVAEARARVVATTVGLRRAPVAAEPRHDTRGVGDAALGP